MVNLDGLLVILSLSPFAQQLPGGQAGGWGRLKIDCGGLARLLKIKGGGQKTHGAWKGERGRPYPDPFQTNQEQHFSLRQLSPPQILGSREGGRFQRSPTIRSAGLTPKPRGLGAAYLKVDFVHDLVVGLELVKLHFEVRRRQDVGEDHGVEVHGLLVAPQRQHVALLARHRRLGGAAAAWLLLLGHGRGRLVLRLRVACQRGAVVSHVAAARRREGGGGGPSSIALFGTTVPDLLHGRPSGRGARRVVPQPRVGLQLGHRHTNPGPAADSKHKPQRSRAQRRAASQGARSLPPTAPRNKMAGPAEVTTHARAFELSPWPIRAARVGRRFLFLVARGRCWLDPLRRSLCHPGGFLLGVWPQGKGI